MNFLSFTDLQDRIYVQSTQKIIFEGSDLFFIKDSYIDPTSKNHYFALVYSKRKVSTLIYIRLSFIDPKIKN